jgi:hypothetical protein
MNRWLYRDGWSPLALALEVMVMVIGIIFQEAVPVIVGGLAAAQQACAASPAGQRRRARRPNHKNPDNF